MCLCVSVCVSVSLCVYSWRFIAGLVLLQASVKRDLIQCQKRPNSVKRDLLQCQKRPNTEVLAPPPCVTLWKSEPLLPRLFSPVFFTPFFLFFTWWRFWGDGAAPDVSVCVCVCVCVYVCGWVVVCGCVCVHSSRRFWRHGAPHGVSESLVFALPHLQGPWLHCPRAGICDYYHYYYIVFFIKKTM